MEKATTIPTVHLSSAAGLHRMPVVGMGMAADPFDATALKLSVLEAIKLGYRHFDTATVYGSEKLLGEAIAEALQLGLIGSREELFITSKVWSSDGYHDLVVPALKKSLQTLQLEYLDLYLIHMPISAKPGKWTMQIDKEDLAPMDFKSVWAAMEECQKLGLTKSIGVSNFSCKKLQNILSSATIHPSVNQVEMNPVWQQKKLIDFCKANNIIVTAFSPLGAQGTRWASNNVMDSEVLKDIAKAKGKTVAQVALKWIIEQGATLVVKTVKKERMKQNLDIFDWAFSEDDLNKIKQIPQQRGMLKEELLSANGPYKSLDEFWDGEF